MHDFTLGLSYLLGGICLYACAFHAVIGLRRPMDSTQLVFAALCAATGCLGIASANVGKATDPMAYLEWLRWSVNFGVLTYLVQTWFVAFYTKTLPKLLLYPLSAFYLVVLFVNTFGEQTIQYQRLDSIKSVVMPWGEPIAFGVGVPSAWFKFGSAALLAAHLFMLYASLAHFRARRTSQSWAILAAVLLAALGTLQGMLVRFGIADFIQLGPFAFLGLVVVMSMAMNQEFVDRSRRIDRDQKAMLENDLAGLFKLECDRIIWTNLAFLKIVGYEQEELKGKSIRMLYPDDSPFEAFDSASAPVLSQGRVYRTGTEFARKDGQLIWVALSGTVLDEATGMSMWTVLDITEQKIQEDQLRLSETMRRKAQDIAGFGSYATNLKTGIWQSSDVLDAIFGIDASYPHDIPNWNKILAPEFREAALNHYLAVAQEHAEFRMDYQIIRPVDGVRRWVAANGELEYNEVGEPVQLIGTIQDITSRKEYELELEAHKRNLEGLVLERTKELEIAKETAVAANRAKSSFLTNMSHEIRTPLNVITGMTHLVRRSGVTPEQSDRLGKIEMAGSHLLEIINSILDLSKIEAGKLTLEEVQLDVRGMVANVVSIFEQQAQAKKLRMVIDNRLVSHNYRGDLTRLQQCLFNFVSNAIKFSDGGQITIRVCQLGVEEASELIQFEVEDQGIGADPAILGRLFSPFEQADNTTTRQYGGTGLGLAITKKLSQLMGGDAGASSQLGQGSRFWFTAKLRADTPSSISEPPVTVLSAEAILARDYARSRLLLVEDDEFNQEIALILLNEIWPEVELAQDGLQAVELVKQKPFDLILMDMQMPRLDGLDATRQIRTLPNGAKVPIIAMTANAFVEDRNRCLESGMNDFLTKPVKPVELYELILKWIRR
jgi:PAS domain S-box-containing protein